MIEIKRDTYLQKIIKKEGNGLVKIITGIRRCGKSYLLFKIFHDYLINKGIKDDHIIEVEFDNIKFKELRKPEKMYSYVEERIIDDNLYYVILDEVQFLDEFVDVLNGFLHLRNVDVYVTGSNSRFLSRDVVTEFRGRGDEIHMLPLSFSEYVSAHNGNIDDAWENYYLYGGLPLIMTLDDLGEKEAYLQSLFKEVYLTDILERHNMRNKEEFGELMDILSSSIGSLTNPLKLSKTFKSVKNKTISDMTISRYIEYLEDAFLINRVSRYDIKGRKYIGSPAKYYFEDIGLRNARLNFRQVEENHIMENIIYNELRFRGYLVDIGVVESIERDEKGNKKRKQYEVDFIAIRGQQKVYIQSAFVMNNPEKTRQEQQSLRQIPDSFKKIIVIREHMNPRFDNNGFIIVGIHQFLLNPDILK